MTPPEDVRAALERMLASATFSSADRLSRFLRFAVEKTLAGEADDVKEYSVGSEVFDRGADFDPRLDPIVRVEARRLRAKIDEYYAGPGREEPVRILLPKGSYVPAFEAAAVPSVPVVQAPKRNWPAWWPAVVGVLLIGLGVVTWAMNRAAVPAGTFSIAVLPSSDESERDYIEGLGEALSVELARDARWRVLAWPVVDSFWRREGRPLNMDFPTAAKELKVERLMAINSRRRDGKRRVVGMLVSPGERMKQWAGEYERDLTNEFATQREIARAIADEARAAADRKAK